MNYLSLLLNKDHAVSWIDHIKSLLVKCLTHLTTLKVSVASDQKLDAVDVVVVLY